MGCWKNCSCLRPPQDDLLDCKKLDFSHLNLQDVPNEVFIAERTLQELILDSNSINDLPRNLFHCTGLRKFSISNNSIKNIPNAITSLVYLQDLNISRNNLDNLPDVIKCCKCLKIVDCSVNPLEKIPDGLTQLINLKELYLNDILLEFLPASFGRLTQLKVLELRENNIKVLPKSFSRLVELERLDIGQNELIELPEPLSNLPKLGELWCDDNKLVSIPSSIGIMVQLTYLDLSDNKIESISPEIGNCANLVDLTLSHNRISDLPESIGNLSKLTTLRLDSNILESLPHSIGNLTSLQELLINNNLIESFPTSIGLLRNLHTLIADSNQLKELPSSIGSCNLLRLLSLAFNALTKLPDEIGRLSCLKVLNLSGNQLINLPFSLAKISELKALWLSNKQHKPIMKLQTDEENGVKVLTCFLLPQQSNSDFDEAYISDKDNDFEGKQSQSNEIKFCPKSEKNDDEPARFIRNPTPLPRKLKVYARHARNLALKHKEYIEHCTSKEFNSDTQLPEINQLKIKEAKVFKPEDFDSSSHEKLEKIKSKQNLIDQQSSAQSNLKDYPIYDSEPKAYTKMHAQNKALLIHDIDRGYRSDQECTSNINRFNSSGYASDVDYNSLKLVKNRFRPKMKDLFVELHNKASIELEDTNMKHSHTLLDTRSSCMTDETFLSNISLCTSSEIDRSKSINYSPSQHSSLYDGTHSNSYISTLHFNTLPRASPRSKIISAPSSLIIQQFSRGAFNENNFNRISLFSSPLNSSYKTISPKTNFSHQHGRQSQTDYINFPVIIVKNPGIGFTIEGGTNFPLSWQNEFKGHLKTHNIPNTSIWVEHVVENGPASTALQRGDILLQANGIDLISMSKEEAFNVLHSNGNMLSLMILRVLTRESNQQI